MSMLINFMYDKKASITLKAEFYINAYSMCAKYSTEQTVSD